MVQNLRLVFLFSLQTRCESHLNLFDSKRIAPRAKQFRSRTGLTATLRVWEDYLAAAEARDILAKCRDISQSGFLVHEKVRGQPVKRRSCAFSDPGYTYSYNGASHKGRDWPHGSVVCVSAWLS